MASRNVEVVRRAASAYVRGDLDGWLEMFDPAVEWRGTGEGPMGGPRHGIEGVRQFLGEWREQWDEYSVETEEFIDAGSAVVLVLHERARGRASRVATERRLAGVYTFRGNKVVRAEHYAKVDDALRAVGLRV